MSWKTACCGVFLFCATLIVISPAGASTLNTDPPASVWSAEAELGGVRTSGNTESSNFNASLMVSAKRLKWDHKATFSGFYSSGAGDDETRIFTFSISSGYKISKADYVVTTFEYENDPASGYNYKFHESIGYGHKLIDGETVMLKIEAGPGGRHSKLNNGEQVDELILRAASDFIWKISKTATFTENILALSGDNGTVVESISAIKSSIIGALAMKISLKVKRNSDPPEDVEETDTITSVTLVYRF